MQTISMISSVQAALNYRRKRSWHCLHTRHMVIASTAKSGIPFILFQTPGLIVEWLYRIYL